MNAPWFVRIVTSGHRKSFHVHMNWITASVASAGSDSGSTIRTRIDSREAPSIRAASSSSIGQRPEELREHEDAEDVREVRHDERAEVVDQPEVLHDQERRDQHDLQRHHQRREQQEVDEPAPEEPDPRERVRRERAQDEVARRRPRRSRRSCSRTTCRRPTGAARPGSCRTAACPATGSAGSGGSGPRVSSDVTTIHTSGSEHDDGERDEEQVPRIERQQPARGRSTIPVSPGSDADRAGFGRPGPSVTRAHDE